MFRLPSLLLFVRGSAGLAVPPPVATFRRTAAGVQARCLRLRAQAPEQPEGYASLAEFPDFGGTARLIKMAKKASLTVRPNPKITNSKKQAQSFAASRVDAFTSTITKALKEKQQTFHDLMRRLRPFEAEVATLTMLSLERSGGLSLQRVMKDFDLMRRAVGDTMVYNTLTTSKAVRGWLAKVDHKMGD